jgi:hypothetical protein
MSFTKQAHQEALTKIAEQDARERNDAYELGFIKAAQDMGLNEEQFAQFHAHALKIQETERAAATPAK